MSPQEQSILEEFLGRPVSDLPDGRESSAALGVRVRCVLCSTLARESYRVALPGQVDRRMDLCSTHGSLFRLACDEARASPLAKPLSVAEVAAEAGRRLLSDAERVELFLGVRLASLSRLPDSGAAPEASSCNRCGAADPSPRWIYDDDSLGWVVDLCPACLPGFLDVVRAREARGG